MNSKPEREVAIFTETLRAPPQERDEFLTRACGGDDDLCRKVEALLKAHERAGNFLEKPPAETSIE